MNVPVEIKSMPWSEPGKMNALQKYSVRAYKKIIAGKALYVIDFIENENRNCSWVSAPTIRVVVSKHLSDFLVLEKGKSKYVRRKVNWFYQYSNVEIDERSEKILKRLGGSEENHGIYGLACLLTGYYDVRLEQERKKRGLINDGDVYDCPTDIPDGLMDYVRRKIINNDRTLIYKHGNVRGICAYCGEKVKANNTRFRQHYTVNCPNCGEKVRCILENSAAAEAREVGALSAIQQGKNGDLWLRTWVVTRNNDARYHDLANNLQECARYLIRARKAAMWVINNGKAERSKIIYDRYYHCNFFDKNIVSEIRGTSLQYARLPEYAQNNDDTLMYCINFCRYPVMEFLWKRGFEKIVHQKNRGYCAGHGNCIYWQRKRVKDCFKIPLALLNMFEPADMTLALLDKITILNNMGIDWNEIKAILSLDVSVGTIKRVKRFVTIHKALKYLSIGDCKIDKNS